MERPEHPRDLAELCQRFAEMRVGLKPWAQTAMDYALDNRLQVALGSARDMAKACGIPTSTVSRLVRLFGFRCFADFRNVFKQDPLPSPSSTSVFCRTVVISLSSSAAMAGRRMRKHVLGLSFDAGDGAPALRCRCSDRSTSAI